MSWLKSGDNAATYPALLSVAMLEDADDRLLDEIAGFVWRCASQSAGHMTNGVIDLGTVALIGGPRTKAKLAAALAVGLMTPTVDAKGRTAYRIVQDPEFLHIRDKEAVVWERQRDRDRKSPELTSAVRARDGDACRYCGAVVNFSARKGGRSGTYDHFEPGKPASVETYVVACRSHNSAMQDGERLPLLDPPAMPYYTAKTLAWLEDNGRKPAAGTYRTDPVPDDDPDLTEGGHRNDSARPARAEDPASQRESETLNTAATERDQDDHSAAVGATLRPQPSEREPKISNTAATDERDQDDHSAAVGATLDPHRPATPATSGDPASEREPWLEDDLDEDLVDEDRSDHARPVDRSPPDPSGSIWVGPGSDLGRDLDPKGGAWSGRDGTGRARSGRAWLGRDGPGRGGAGAAQRRGRRSGRRRRWRKGGR